MDRARTIFRRRTLIGQHQEKEEEADTTRDDQGVIPGYITQVDSHTERASKSILIESNLKKALSQAFA